MKHILLCITLTCILNLQSAQEHEHKTQAAQIQTIRAAMHEGDELVRRFNQLPQALKFNISKMLTADVSYVEKVVFLYREHLLQLIIPSTKRNEWLKLGQEFLTTAYQQFETKTEGFSYTTAPDQQLPIAAYISPHPHNNDSIHKKNSNLISQSVDSFIGHLKEGQFALVVCANGNRHIRISQSDLLALQRVLFSLHSQNLDERNLIDLIKCINQPTHNIYLSQQTSKTFKALPEYMQQQLPSRRAIHHQATDLTERQKTISEQLIALCSQQDDPFFSYQHMLAWYELPIGQQNYVLAKVHDKNPNKHMPPQEVLEALKTASDDLKYLFATIHHEINKSFWSRPYILTQEQSKLFSHLPFTIKMYFNNPGKRKIEFSNFSSGIIRPVQAFSRDVSKEELLRLTLGIGIIAIGATWYYKKYRKNSPNLYKPLPKGF